MRKSHLLFWWPKNAKKIGLQNIGQSTAGNIFTHFQCWKSSPASVTCSLSSGFSSATTWEFLATNNDDDNCMVESPGCQQRQHQKKEESRPTHTASSWQIRRLQIPIDIRWEVIPQKLTKGIVPEKKKSLVMLRQQFHGRSSFKYRIPINLHCTPKFEGTSLDFRSASRICCGCTSSTASCLISWSNSWNEDCLAITAKESMSLEEFFSRIPLKKTQLTQLTVNFRLLRQLLLLFWWHLVQLCFLHQPSHVLQHGIRGSRTAGGAGSSCAHCQTENLKGRIDKKTGYFARGLKKYDTPTPKVLHYYKFLKITICVLLVWFPQNGSRI